MGPRVKPVKKSTIESNMLWEAWRNVHSVVRRALGYKIPLALSMMGGGAVPAVSTPPHSVCPAEPRAQNDGR